MLQYTGNFNTAIKEQVRQVDVALAFLDANNEVFYLESSDLQELNYASTGKKELGCIVRKVIDAKFMVNEKTQQIKKGDFFNLFYLCGEGKCKADIFYISQLKTSKNKSTITIEAVDLLTYNQDNPTSSMPIMKNTSLETYMKEVFEHTGYGYKIGDIVNPRLSLGYPKSLKLADTLEEIAIASHSMISFRSVDNFKVTLPFFLPHYFDEYKISTVAKIDCKPFKFNEPCDSIGEDDMILEFTVDQDNSDMWNDVKVSLFFPGSTEQKSIGNLKATVPSSVNNYNIGTVEFGSTVIPQIVKLSGRIDIADYLIGSDRCTIKVNNNQAIAVAIEGEFLGLDINESTLSNGDTDSNCKQINNMYIQSSSVYDTRIYKNPNASIKYRGNPAYEVGDTITVEGQKVLITEHKLTYNGGLKGTIKGVVLNG